MDGFAIVQVYLANANQTLVNTTVEKVMVKPDIDAQCVPISIYVPNV